MPKLGTSFSESSFAFGFTENLLNGGLLAGSAAPRFLSTYAEGMGEHWDVHIPARPVAFFFQFKIPDVLQRGRGLQNKLELRSPFYRMNLRSENGYAQHHGLLRLEGGGENIYYACPRFHTGEDFNALFALREIPQRSVWFRPSQVTPPDYLGPHGIAYDVYGNNWEVRSPDRKTRNDPIGYENFVGTWKRAVDGAKPRRPDTFIAALADTIESAIHAAERGRAAVEAAIRAADEARAAAAKELEQRPTEKAPGDMRVDYVYHVAPSDLPPLPRFHPPKMGLMAQTVTRARGILGLEILIGGKD